MFFATSEEVILSWDETFYSLLTEARVLSYQLWHNKCFHLAKIFKFMVAEILFLLYEELTPHGAGLGLHAGCSKIHPKTCHVCTQQV
jgi:hypothetical protein